jgi:DNA-binding sugar fermentation-stimulating protein
MMTLPKIRPRWRARWLQRVRRFTATPKEERGREGEFHLPNPKTLYYN